MTNIAEMDDIVNYCDSCQKISKYQSYRCLECPDHDLCIYCCNEDKIKEVCKAPHKYVKINSIKRKELLGPSLFESFCNCFSHYSPLILTGQRDIVEPREIKLNEAAKLHEIKYGEYSYLTYNQFYTRAMQFGAGFESILPAISSVVDENASYRSKKELFESQKFHKAGVLSRNSVEYLISYYGCKFHSIVTVPLGINLMESEFNHIAKITEMNILITSLDFMMEYLPRCLTTSIEYIVLLCTEIELKVNEKYFLPLLEGCKPIKIYSIETLELLGKDEEVYHKYPPVVYQLIPEAISDNEDDSYGDENDDVDGDEGEGEEIEQMDEATMTNEDEAKIFSVMKEEGEEGEDSCAVGQIFSWNPPGDNEIEEESVFLNYKKLLNHPLATSRLVEISFTSGSTGAPKGAIFDEILMLRTLEVDMTYTRPLIALEFLPFSFMTARENVSLTIIVGGRIIIYNHHDKSHLLEDLKLIRPTKITAVPSFWNKIYGEFKSEYMLNSMSSSGGEITKKKLREKYSQMFGDRLTAIVTGGAYTSRKVMLFLWKVFAVNRVGIFDAYGSTEAGGISTNGSINGSSEFKYKLRDVPELNYFSTDKPYPRGELLVKTAHLISGYYKNEQDTNKHFTDGWYHTGDIVSLNSGSLTIVDRLSNFIKLPVGEFIYPNKLENIFLESELITQIYVHADPKQSAIIAFVECSNSGITEEQILEHIRSLGKLHNLRPHEIPSAVCIVRDGFTAENGRLTNSEKIARPKCNRDFSSVAESMYQTINKNNEEFSILRLLSDTLGYEVPNESAQFQMDSLSAVKFYNEMEKKSPGTFNISLSDILQSNSVADLLGTSNDTKSKADHDLFQEDCKTYLPWLQDKKHDFSNYPYKFSPNDFELEKIHAVLVTGATGVLGFEIVNQLVQCYPNLQIYCLIRATNESDALEKLIKTGRRFSYPPSVFTENASLLSKVHCIPGDFSKPKLALSDEKYNELAAVIDVVFHSGAYVNWVLPYSVLREPNFIGTKNILEFCLPSSSNKEKLKYLHFISTASVCNFSLGTHSQFSGYTQSKWLAEIYVRHFGETGILPVQLYRPGSITGCSYGTVTNKSDFTNRLLCAIINLGVYPNNSMPIELLPVDYLVSQFFDWSKIRHSQGSVNCYCATNPTTYPLKKIGKTISQLGYPVTRISLSNFLRKVAAEPEGELFPLLPLIKKSSFWKSNSGITKLIFITY